MYISGHTDGDLAGSNAGRGDLFISKYNTLGEMIWTRQLGSNYDDQSTGIAVDSLGYVYLTGMTMGDLAGVNAGNADSMVAKYDPEGNLIWKNQFGTSAFDTTSDIAIDHEGNVYVSGSTLGGVSNDGSNEIDAFIVKFNPAGNFIWDDYFVSESDDIGRGIAFDNKGNVYTAGYTYGDISDTNSGKSDAFIRKYDLDGNVIWTEQFGSENDDIPSDIATDMNGNIYIVGSTEGSLGGENPGLFDLFVTRYDEDGNYIHTNQLGGGGDDIGLSVSTDSEGSVYVAGFSDTGLFGANSDPGTIFLMKLLIVPEPSAAIMLLTIMLILSVGCHRRRNSLVS